MDYPMKPARLALLLSLPLGFVLASFAPAAEPTTAADALAAQIDKQIAARWRQAGIRPASPSSDAEFVRRIYLDVTGVIPTVAQVRIFLADPSMDKRRRLIERLVDGPGFVRHRAAEWRRLIAPDAENDPNRQAAAAALEKWLQRQFAQNIGFDRTVRSILTWPMDENLIEGEDPAAPSPRLFYQGRTKKPEELAAATTRLFLGVRLECSQCHNHPFAKWTREQFWNQAAFFTTPDKNGNGHSTIAIPGTSQQARARFLDGAVPLAGSDARRTLAEWVVSPTNRYFARAAVNRLWEQFFGVGLVDPVDDLIAENPPSHPELLDTLAQAFVDNGCDIRMIVRAILLSNTYQLSSLSLDAGELPDPRLFSHMNVKALSPEQAFDSLLVATGYRGRDLQAMRGRFLARMTRGEQRLEGQSSIPQVLGMMNGDFLQAALRPEGEHTLGALLASPFQNADGDLEILFLAALGRQPSVGEKSRCHLYRKTALAEGRGEKALSDIFWALLNSAEFLHNQ
jgi:hypothetical protein